MPEGCKSRTRKRARRNWNKSKASGKVHEEKIGKCFQRGAPEISFNKVWLAFGFMPRKSLRVFVVGLLFSRGLLEWIKLNPEKYIVFLTLTLMRV
jgi:hypothetical protein